MGAENEPAPQPVPAFNNVVGFDIQAIDVGGGFVPGWPWNPVRFVSEQGKHILIEVSESKRTLYGFSTIAERGEWHAMPIEPGNDEAINPSVSGDVACVIVGKQAYGFSARKGEWAVAELCVAGIGRGENGTLSVSQQHVEIVIDTKRWIFSSAGGRWSCIDRAVDVRE